MSKIKLGLLLTGDELLSGDIVDTNSVFIAQRLQKTGLTIAKKVIVGDCRDSLARAIVSLTKENDIVIINGGLGSTVDDLTAEVAAEVSGMELWEHPAALQHLEMLYKERKLPKKSKQFRQAFIPKEAEIIPNPIGSAVGFTMKINKALCYFTPGVPHELKAMLSETIIPHMERAFDLAHGRKLNSLTLMGIGELQVQEKIHAHLDKELIQDKVGIGFRAFSPFTELKLFTDKEEHYQLLEQITGEIRQLLEDYIIESKNGLPSYMINLLQARQKTLSLAESCTGGLIASKMTEVPGASDVFHAGFVTYSNESKVNLIDVTPDVLEEHGAVSKPVVEEMVQGALKKSGTDYAIAVSGIAGPGGGTKEKPTGTVYIGWGSPEKIQVRRLLIPQERTMFQNIVCATALDLLRRFIHELPVDCPYFFDRHSSFK